MKNLAYFYIRRTKEGLWGKGIFSDAKQGKHKIEGYLVILNNVSMRKYRKHKKCVMMGEDGKLVK